MPSVSKFVGAVSSNIVNNDILKEVADLEQLCLLLIRYLILPVRIIPGTGILFYRHSRLGTLLLGRPEKARRDWDERGENDLTDSQRPRGKVTSVAGDSQNQPISLTPEIS